MICFLITKVREILKGQDLDDVDFSDIDRHVDVARQQISQETKIEMNNHSLTVTANFDHFDKDETSIEKQEINKESTVSENDAMSETNELDSDNISASDANIFKPLTSEDVEKQVEKGSPPFVKKNEMENYILCIDL